jgi:hypothetical protein
MFLFIRVAVTVAERREGRGRAGCVSVLKLVL